MRTDKNGFTLIETLVVTSIATILLGLVIPACRDAVAKAGTGAAKSAMLATLNDAVRHAGTTGTEVVLCPSLPGQTCLDSFDWSQGWHAFADINGNRERDDDELLVADTPALRWGARLLSSTGRRRLILQPSGGNAGSNVTFTLCAGLGSRHVETLILSNTGGLRSVRNTPAAVSVCNVAP